MVNLLVYSDESELKGDYYSNFYGAIIVDFNQLANINKDLEEYKSSLGLTGELKWNKINYHRRELYVDYINYFFDNYIKQGKAKVRILFTQNRHEYTGIACSDDEKYYKLYYQLLKNGLGLYHHNYNEPVFVRFYVDRLPFRSKSKEFKNYIANLSSNHFFNKNIIIKEEDITEIDSEKHILLQSLDIVLGAMQFKLNRKHEYRDVPGKIPSRTKAKLEVYKAINQKICEMKPNFNIGISTGISSDIKRRWNDDYRHWRFVPNEMRVL